VGREKIIRNRHAGKVGPRDTNLIFSFGKEGIWSGKEWTKKMGSKRGKRGEHLEAKKGEKIV